ncbi:hypothetical protein M0802_006812 [Mischocyttarus mexicanus]|nr:hypothetical protein M0802_006812 [Mischocyttarus mexicanus]
MYGFLCIGFHYVADPKQLSRSGVGRGGSAAGAGAGAGAGADDDYGNTVAAAVGQNKTLPRWRWFFYQWRGGNVDNSRCQPGLSSLST